MRLKDIFFRKEKNFEKELQLYAIYSPDKRSVRFAPTQKIFGTRKLKFISSGLQARVYKIEDIDWVVKEGRWDLELNLFGNTKLPLPAAFTEKALQAFSYTFLPTIPEILRQYKAYLKFIQYFGYFDKKECYYHPNLDLIINAQRHIRASLSFHREDLEEYYKMKFKGPLDEILKSDLANHNFLPKEYLLIGKGVSNENQNRTTFFIVQEFVKGELLHDLDPKLLSPFIKKQLTLMIYLILLMNYQIHLVPDTRPRYPILQVSNWLTKTDNVIASNDQLKFIDTRWFWDYNSNPIKRGLIIPDMIINLAKSYINVLLNDLN